MSATPSSQQASESADHVGWAQRLLALLESQSALIDRLTELAGRQRSLIESGRTDALLTLLEQRQRLVDEFVSSQREFQQLAHGLDERVKSLDEDTRGRIRDLVSKISGSLDTVMQQDQSDQDLLRSSRDETKQKLGDLDRGSQARGAYLQRSRATNRFADKQG